MGVMERDGKLRAKVVPDTKADTLHAKFTLRHNRRKMDEGQRVNALLGKIKGRLTYRGLVA